MNHGYSQPQNKGNWLAFIGVKPMKKDVNSNLIISPKTNQSLQILIIGSNFCLKTF
jgi:hypothetical protein